MKIIDNLDNLHIQEKTAVAIGKFDGVHLGHRALIDELKMAKEKQGLATVVFTFSPSPAEFFGLSDTKTSGSVAAVSLLNGNSIK